MARGGGRPSGAGARRRRPSQVDNRGLMPVLAQAVREVEGAVQRGPVRPSVRYRFQAIALLVREYRARVESDPGLTEAARAEERRRLEGIATILARTAARSTDLFGLLADAAVISDGTRELRREMMVAAGMEVPDEPDPEPPPQAAAPTRQVVPQAIISRTLANPFLAPDYSAALPAPTRSGRLASWELIGPLLDSFERASNGAVASMSLPDPDRLRTPDGALLMKHQAQVVAAAADGHRTFLLADEPGLGKTAQALLAAQATDAYPLLVVVPNVVKANWAREAGLWTPKRPVTVVHGDGETIDGFSDIVVVNYEILDRHVGWLGRLGFRGMVLDEAHFIKNKNSQRSRNVLQLSERIRDRTVRPLLMALTGTPLINDIDDFRAIWQFLGWIEEKKPRPLLMSALEEAGWTPADSAFYPSARSCVIDLGIVRRRKADVAADIPARRIADLPVELDGPEGRSIREAERELGNRLVRRYQSALAAKVERGVPMVEGIDIDLVRQVAKWEREQDADSGDNVFAMMRKIGQAKAAPAADYAAQLARSVGKVVFFAKHVDVMDAAEDVFRRAGLRFVSIRGNQTARTRAKAIDDFTHDPDVAVVVCSLTAAGVGLNLQVSSNVVLAELSWTDAEQTQAIDRVHRIGQSLPVTAWRVIAAQTIDVKVAELIDSKAGLAARALDGSDEDVASSADIQLEALIGLLTDALVAAGPLSA